jgi:cellulose synthase/poly-beta-1,6-N-acetylglucosamine synthase-like glycosyltransferase
LQVNREKILIITVPFRFTALYLALSTGMIILFIVLFLFAAYSILIIYYWLGWQSTPQVLPQVKSLVTPVSVIVAARNEEKNIGTLLNAIYRQTYPKHLLQIIVVDDHSTDGTAEVVRKFDRATLVELKNREINSYKKKAIEEGVATASGKLIITTDADCVPPPKWLETIVSFYEAKNCILIAAPVALEINFSVIELFQALDFLVLQGITAASVHKRMHAMCNGANLAYEKTAFQEVNGFYGIDNIASGDDMLLMQKIWKRFPDKICYAKSKDVIVRTQPMKTWKELLNQRIRWASKARFYKDPRISSVLLVVYAFNLSFLALLIFGFWFPVLWIYILVFWVAKTMVEFPFVYSVARFFDQQSLLKYFFFFQPLHIAYTIIAGWLGQSGTYEWKGRKVR